MKLVRKLLLAFSVGALVISNSSVAQAIVSISTDSNLYRTSNNIVFYDPNDTGKIPCGESGALTGSENLEKIFNYFKSKGLNDVQAAAAIGNIDQESGGDPTIIQGGKHTDDPSNITGSVGWGIIQWTPGKKVIGIAADAGITGAINLLETQVAIVWWHMTNLSPTGRTNMLKNYTYSSDSQLLAAVTYYHDTMEGSADTTMANRLAKAKNALRKYGTGQTTPADASAPTDPSAADAISTTGQAATSCDGAATGSAVTTAVKYAWPTYHSPPYLTMKPEYAAAVKNAQSSGGYVGGGAHPGIDCGGFVTTVMRDSGADKKYNEKNGNTNAQRAYMQGSDLYEEIHPNSTADMKPGDIAVNGDHTYMYVGKVKGFETEVASASISYSGQSWRAPMAGHERPADQSYSWFRLKSAQEVI